ncbi:MAG: nitroreductase family protein [Treponema sp.]|nr:nitroreductase family protein [Treponema sp.]
MELKEAVLSRRTIRAYEKTEIKESDVKEIIAFAQNAPSWKNSQTGRYYAALSEEKITAVKNALPAFNQERSLNAVYIVVSFKKRISGFDTQNDTAANECGDEWGAYDLGLQNMLLMLKARELGLDTLIMGLRDSQAIKKAVSIPEDEEVMAVIALGKRAQNPDMPPRKNLDEILSIQ